MIACLQLASSSFIQIIFAENAIKLNQRSQIILHCSNSASQFDSCAWSRTPWCACITLPPPRVRATHRQSKKQHVACRSTLRMFWCRIPFLPIPQPANIMPHTPLHAKLCHLSVCLSNREACCRKCLVREAHVLWISQLLYAALDVERLNRVFINQHQ